MKEEKVARGTHTGNRAEGAVNRRDSQKKTDKANPNRGAKKKFRAAGIDDDMPKWLLKARSSRKEESTNCS